MLMTGKHVAKWQFNWRHLHEVIIGDSWHCVAILCCNRGKELQFLIMYKQGLVNGRCYTNTILFSLQTITNLMVM